MYHVSAQGVNEGMVNDKCRYVYIWNWHCCLLALSCATDMK